MDSPSEWRDTALKSSDVVEATSSELAEDTAVVWLDVTKRILEARTSAIDAVRQYYHQATQYGSSNTSVQSSKGINPTPSASSPLRRSVALNLDSGGDVASTMVVFPIVTGPIGSGKSQLIQFALKDQVCQVQGGYYIYAKFDLLQHADPHRPFVVAWTEFAEEVVRRGPGSIRTMRDTVMASCQSETSALLAMIPALRDILEYPDDTTMENRGPAASERRLSVSLTPPSEAATRQRFLFVFQAFLKAIARLEHPMVLVLEDLQWTDPGGIDFLCSILQDVRDIPGLFVIGTYDDGALDVSPVDDDSTGQENYLGKKLQEIFKKSSHAVAVKTIPIHDLDFDQVKHVLNQTLQQCSLFDLQIEDDICQVVYQQTHGNMVLMVEFLKWLYRVGLLKKDSPRNTSTSFTYWTWSIDAIRRKISDRVKDIEGSRTPFFVTDLLNELPMKMIELLKVCACFGYLHTEDTLLEYVLQHPVSSILSEAVKLGILDMMGSGTAAFAGRMYCFKNDILQMAAYDLIPESNRELFHLEIGRRLWRQLSQDELDHYIFVVMAQLILGRRLISRPKERYSIASLCLHAGRKAANLSNFRAASIYLNFGIELLGDLGWKHVYDVALAIHNDAFEMEMCAANFEGMQVLFESIIRHARCDADKLPARTTQLYSLSVSDRHQEGLDLGIQLLSDVGSPLPKRLSLLTLLRQLRSVQSLLKGKSNDYFKRMAIVEDEGILVAMRILHLVRITFVSSCFLLLKHFALNLFLLPAAFSSGDLATTQVDPVHCFEDDKVDVKAWTLFYVPFSICSVWYDLYRIV
jgi:predicted ATPase